MLYPEKHYDGIAKRVCRAHTDGNPIELCRALADMHECIQIEVRVRMVDFWLDFIVQKELNDLSPAEARQLIQKRTALLRS
jgi:hypothetical protein